jgi:hypothetical protein
MTRRLQSLVPTSTLEFVCLICSIISCAFLRAVEQIKKVLPERTFRTTKTRKCWGIHRFKILPLFQVLPLQTLLNPMLTCVSCVCLFCGLILVLFHKMSVFVDHPNSINKRRRSRFESCSDLDFYRFISVS